VNPQHYGKLLEENLKNHRPELLRQLRSEGNLESFLSETAEEAFQAFNHQVRELKKLNPEPKGFLERVSWFRQIWQAADEYVRLNLIQLPDSDTEKAIRQGGYKD